MSSAQLTVMFLQILMTEFAKTVQNRYKNYATIYNYG